MALTVPARPMASARTAREEHLTPYASSFLNMMRWTAALAVLINHARNAFVIPFSNYVSASMPIKLCYLLTSCGREAVIIFFVLSGFFIGSSVLTAYRQNTWSWPVYFINRISRLYIVLIPALLVGALLDYYGLKWWGFHGIYSTIGSGHLLARFTLSTWLMNLCMLQNIYVQPFGSNDPLWSLSYEFWYYLLFPLLVSVALCKSWRARLIGLIIFCAGCCLVHDQILTYFPIWLIGVLVTIVIDRFPAVMRIKKAGVFLAAIGFGVVVLTIRMLEKYSLAHHNLLSSLYVRDLLLALAFAALCYVIICYGQSHNTSAPAFSAFHSFMAGFSYTIYLVHFPFLAFVLMLWLHHGGSIWRINFSGICALFAVCLLTLLFALGIWYFTERHTATVRRALMGKYRQLTLAAGG